MIGSLVLAVACSSPQGATPSPAQTSAPALSAATPAATPAATSGVPQATTAVIGLSSANAAYVSYAAGILQRLSADVGALQADLAASDLAAARRDWLTAQLDWERVGASYNSFGTLGIAVAGLPGGLPQGVDDPGFTGLHRLEYGLWHGQSPETLRPIADRLAADIETLADHLGDSDVAGNPLNLALRANEILEDALRDHLSGIDNQGAGAGYAETLADIDATRAVLAELAPLVQAQSPRLIETATKQMDLLAAALQEAKQSGQWLSPAATPLATRQRINAAIGQLLETLSVVPNLLIS